MPCKVRVNPELGVISSCCCLEMVSLLLTPLPVLSSGCRVRRPSDTPSPSLRTSLGSAPHKQVSPEFLSCLWASVLFV